MDLQLFLFGTPRCQRDGRPVRFTRRKGSALLAYLAVTGQTHGRESLAALLYPESAQAMAYLRRDLSELKKSLGTRALRIDSAVALEMSSVWVDVLVFLDQISLGESRLTGGGENRIANLETAVTLYTTDFLAGFSLPDSPSFDEWQHHQAESLRLALAGGLQMLIDHYRTQGEFNKGIARARRWLELDPLHEPAHRELMRLYAAAGQRAAALRQYETCARLLRQELDVTPEEETTALFETLGHPPAAGRALPGSPPDQVTPLTTTLAPPLGRIPEYSTPFIGRKAAVDQIQMLLARPDCRLVTLVGPGGIGKTRLALEAAGSLEFEDGVWFVPLAAVETAAAAPAAMADALGLRFYGTGPTDQLLFRRLRNRRLLLLLDNFEQLLGSGGGRLVTALLREAPRLKLLVTSRERLQVQPEYVYSVPGLSYPDATRLSSSVAEMLTEHGGLSLFVERARQVDADFAISYRNLVDIVRVCRLVEGMPLGLELAASWMAVISPEEIAAEIAHNLDFLATTMRDLPDRHRSMKAAFDASWMRLDEIERQVFSQLSIFRGGFFRRAAEAIVWIGGGQPTILPILSALLHKSFIGRDEDGRYHIHELLRQYGAQRLAEHPVEQKGLFERYTAYFLQLMAEQEPRLKGPEQPAALDEIRADQDNILAAWDQAVILDRLELILAALRAFFVYWAENARFGEIAQRIDRVVGAVEERLARSDRPSAADRLALARLRVQRGAMGIRTGTFNEDLIYLEKGLTTHRELDAKWEIALTLNLVSGLVIKMGDYERAAATARESLALAKELGDPWLIAHDLIDLGMALKELGDVNEARRCEEECLELARRNGDRRCMAFALCGLGECAFVEGHHDEAARLFRECLALRQAIGDPWGSAYVLAHLGRLAQAQEDREAARTHYLETLQVAEQIGARPLYLDALTELVGMEIKTGNVSPAAQILRYALAEPALTHKTRKQAQTLLARLPPAAGGSPALVTDLDTLVANLLSSLH